MSKIKLTYYDVGLLITCLHEMKRSYDEESIDRINEILLMLLDVQDQIRPGRKKKIPFDDSDIRLICGCLVDFRNKYLREGNEAAADVIGEVLMNFIA